VKEAARLDVKKKRSGPDQEGAYGENRKKNGDPTFPGNVGTAYQKREKTPTVGGARGPESQKKKGGRLFGQEKKKYTGGRRGNSEVKPL